MLTFSRLLSLTFRLEYVMNTCNFRYCSAAIESSGLSLKRAQAEHVRMCWGRNAYLTSLTLPHYPSIIVGIKFLQPVRMHISRCPSLGGSIFVCVGIYLHVCTCVCSCMRVFLWSDDIHWTNKQTDFYLKEGYSNRKPTTTGP